MNVSAINASEQKVILNQMKKPSYTQFLHRISTIHPALQARLAARELSAAGRLFVGEGTYGAPLILDYGDKSSCVRIGSYCSIGNRVQILIGGNHRTDSISTSSFPNYPSYPSSNVPGRGVAIGSDVWVGREALILDGVTIGHGAIVGARAVVSRDVAPYSIVAGAPAREVRRRFEQAVVQELLDSQWWTLPSPSIEKLIPLLQGSDVRLLLEAVREVKR